MWSTNYVTVVLITSRLSGETGSMEMLGLIVRSKPSGFCPRGSIRARRSGLLNTQGSLICGSIGRKLALVNLFLASYLHPDLGAYLTGRILYIDDAAVEMREAPFAQEELKTVGEAAEVLVPVTVSQMALADFRQELELADCVYVASGETFRLLHALKSTGADQLLVDAVRAGKLYAGSSAGAMVAGPSIEPATVMDNLSIAPDLKDYTGLHLTEFVVVPHAQGTTGPYSIDIISKTVEEYGKKWNLLLLRDGQALYVDDRGAMLI